MTETTNAWHTIATLDEQYRPEYEVYAVATYGGSQSYITSVRVFPTGEFQIYVRSGTVQYMTYNFTYYTETNYLNAS